jgi:hypothetical protein
MTIVKPYKKKSSGASRRHSFLGYKLQNKKRKGLAFALFIL